MKVWNWNRKKDQSKKEKELYGYMPVKQFGDFEAGRVSICLWKAVLMFGASFGTVGSIVSAFDMSVNYPAMILAFLAVSFALSFLHYHPLLFNIGYPVAFCIFAVSIFRNRRYVSSGYQAILNLIREDYQTYFGLSYNGEGVETIDDRYMTMTYAFIYLGFFLIVLLNIAISTHMSIFLTMLLTFPFLQFGLYIRKIPSFFFIALLLFVYTAVLFLKRSGHYSISKRQKKDKAFTSCRGVFSYKGHGKTMGQLIKLAFVLAFVFSLITYPLMSYALPGGESSSALKAATDSTIQKMVQGGIASLFNRYDTTGGISGGRLGGVNRVGADYETDLEVTFVPSSLDSVYLKAFTGAEYTGNRWLQPSYEEAFSTEQEAYKEDYEKLTAYLEAERLGLYFDENEGNGQCGKMQIRNVGADPNYLYIPYYTSEDSGISPYIDHSVLYGRSPVGQLSELTYYPYTQNFSQLFEGEDMLYNSDQTDEFDKVYLDRYSAFCKDAYTGLPETVRPALEKVMEEIGEGDTEAETVARIGQYFYEQFQYTLNPGATPYDQDFAAYFLEVQKKGFCAHFATAGTLLCRAYGIPARYVEGYVIQATDISGAEPNEEEKVEEWFTGSSQLSETGVVTVSVPDANAHAWTEIYIDGFGWVPVDFTPPAEDIDMSQEYRSFLQLFAGLFSAQPENGTQSGDSADKGAGNAAKFFTGNSFFLTPVAVVILFGAVAFLLKRLSVRFRSSLARKAAFRAGRYDEVLPYYYHKILRALEKKKEMELRPLLPQELFLLLTTLFPDREADTGRAGTLFEAGIYGRDQLTKEEAQFFIAYTEEILQALK